MCKRLLSERLIPFAEIPEELKRIEDTDRYYITKSGNVYVDYGNDMYFKMSLHESKRNGYLYVAYIGSDGLKHTRRVHRLVAQAYIPNPNNYPIVLHKDNNKANANVENLKWGTASENTQQAVADGLLINDKGFDDSQSMPVTLYDTLTNEKICDYGSIREAAKHSGTPISTICHQIYEQTEYLRKPSYFALYNEPPRKHYVVFERDFFTDEIIGKYVNTAQAASQTGINPRTVAQHCSNGVKPKSLHKNNFRKSYFLWEEIT